MRALAGHLFTPSCGALAELLQPSLLGSLSAPMRPPVAELPFERWDAEPVLGGWQHDSLRNRLVPQRGGYVSVSGQPEGSTGRAGAATEQLERHADPLGPPRPSPATIDAPLVEVHASGPAHRWTLHHLGSLTERYGMPMYQHRSRSDRVSVLVPRAKSQPEAEEVIASFLERIRHWA
jgi:hypothetical protein